MSVFFNRLVASSVSSDCTYRGRRWQTRPTIATSLPAWPHPLTWTHSSSETLPASTISLPYSVLCGLSLARSVMVVEEGPRTWPPLPSLPGEITPDDGGPLKPNLVAYQVCCRLWKNHPLCFVPTNITTSLNIGHVKVLHHSNALVYYTTSK